MGQKKLRQLESRINPRSDNQREGSKDLLKGLEMDQLMGQKMKTRMDHRMESMKDALRV